MNTSRVKLYIFILMSFCHEGFSQTIIDLDKINAIEIKKIKIDLPILDSIPRVNDLIKIRVKRNILFSSSSIGVSQIPIISNGIIVLNADNSTKIFDLKTASDVLNKNETVQGLYKVFLVEKRIQTQSLFGKSYDVLHYLVSIDIFSQDTLWKKQGNYLSIHQANNISYVSVNINDKFYDIVIDNKTGNELYRLISSTPINLTKFIDEGDFLYFLLIGTGGELVAVNKLKGEIVWKIRGEFNNVFLDENKFYTSNQYAIDKKTGIIIWSQNMGIRVVGIIGGYLIGYRSVENDLEMFVFDKNTGKPSGYIWSDDDFCFQCFASQSCNPEFLFAEQSEENKTAGIIKCSNGIYLYIFETVYSSL